MSFFYKIYLNSVLFFFNLFHFNLKIAVFIVNYNMPERADDLFYKIKKNTIWPVDIYLIDNGSDIKNPSINSNIFLKKNLQTCNGWIKGLEYIKKNKCKYFAYVFAITSAEILSDDDFISKMALFLLKQKKAVGIHPSLSPDSTTHWKHLINRGQKRVRETWMIDNIFSMYKADWFDKIGWFDSTLKYAWGIDLETCYLARKNNLSIWVDDRFQIKKVTNIGYHMNRMNMSIEERSMKASENMREVLTKKYGSSYWKIMTENFVTEDMI